MKRPTLEAVAARAGVSKSTVSRVVNGDATVSPDFREVVLRAVNELGYVPHSVARSLVTQRTNAIALIISDPPAGLFADDPMFATVVRSASRALEAAQKHVILMLASTDESRRRVQEYVAAGHVDGVMLVSFYGADPLPAALARLGMPMASYGRPVSAPAVPYVDNDNRLGARIAVEHLLARGRRRIATISGPLDLIAAQDRLGGYRDTLRDTGRRSIIAVGDFTRASGDAAMCQLLEDDPGLDAVFAANDLMAIGALHALRRSGRRVPQDVSVVGFDDIEAALYTDPPLSTVRSPMADQAQGVVTQLLGLFDGGSQEPVILPNELVVRESS